MFDMNINNKTITHELRKTPAKKFNDIDAIRNNNAPNNPIPK